MSAQRCHKCGGRGLHVGRLVFYTKTRQKGLFCCAFANSTHPGPGWPVDWLYIWKRGRSRP